MSAPVVRRIGDRTFSVDVDGRRETVYVAVSGAERWAWCNGQLFYGNDELTRPAAGRRDRLEPIVAPMPAHILKVHVKPGDRVAKGDVVVVLEAMKMELAMRATADGVVKAVHCQEGTLASPDATLVEFEEAGA